MCVAQYYEKSCYAVILMGFETEMYILISMFKCAFGTVVQCTYVTFLCLCFTAKMLFLFVIQYLQS